VIGDCGVAACITAEASAAIFAAVMGCWALGFGVGKAVAWTRKIASVA
jgi:hypothetical protein